MAAAPSGPPTTSLEKLHAVEERIVHAVEVVGRLMEELGSVAGARRDAADRLADDFMKSMREVQVILREEIRSMCDYRPYEHSDYAPRLGTEVSAQMVSCSLGRLEAMQELIERYKGLSQMVQEDPLLT